MWEYPSGRFLPHEVNEGFDGGGAPVSITAKGDLNPDDVVINLSRQPIQKPGQFRRLLEIVPQSGPALEASRDKFRYYRDQGFEPATHEIKK